MILAYVCVLVLIVGLLMWFVSANPKVAECGKVMFACGLLVTLLKTATETIRF